MADPKAEKIEISVQENDVKKQEIEKQDGELSTKEMEKVAGGGLVVGTLS
jgi:hypothetical protein